MTTLIVAAAALVYGGVIGAWILLFALNDAELIADNKMTGFGPNHKRGRK